MTILVAILFLAVGVLAWWVHQLTMSLADEIERHESLKARVDGLACASIALTDTLQYLTGRPIEDLLPHHEAPNLN